MGVDFEGQALSSTLRRVGRTGEAEEGDGMLGLPACLPAGPVVSAVARHLAGLLNLYRIPEVEAHTRKSTWLLGDIGEDRSGSMLPAR